MLDPRMKFDRYHATMGNFSFSDSAIINKKRLADKIAVFYATQRKIPFAPCVGHERLMDSLMTPHLDIPRLRFLRQDKANLDRFANFLDSSQSPFMIRATAPGTIMFANEPFADIEGPFALTQMMEIKFEHAFDEPITIAGRALEMKIEAGDRHLSDFSLRRDGSLERANEVAKYAYIGGFDDTSNMEAAFQLDINAVGTMAHYLVQAFIGIASAINPEKDNRNKVKHFQQIAFERWLDAHPNGTTLLLDTISLRLGIIHAIRAAKSSESRKQAFKAARVDSGNLAKGAKWMRQMFNANELPDIAIIPTGDLDAAKIREIVQYEPSISGFGVGTKLVAEVEAVAGVIFKLCTIERKITIKCSETPGKETLPGQVQVWRCVDSKGFYIKDVITMDICAEPTGNFKAFPLLNWFYGRGKYPSISPIQKQREFVLEQMSKFPDIRNYPVEIDSSLINSRKNLVARMNQDEAGEDGVVMVSFPE